MIWKKKLCSRSENTQGKKGERPDEVDEQEELRDDIRIMLSICEDMKKNLNTSQLDFIESASSRFKQQGSLEKEQLQTLKKIYDTVFWTE
jgi:hypothetical protein